MVSLARFVRDRSADQLTRELLQFLEDVTREYVGRTGHLPDVPAILAADDLRGAEPAVEAAARANNAKFVEQLRGDLARVEIRNLGTAAEGASHSHLRAQAPIGSLPISLYNERTLADAWGNPIVFMADQHPAIGMAPLRQLDPGRSGPRTNANDGSGGAAAPADVGAGGEHERAWFFVSAGPDGRFLTREDNLYSYEQARR
jgi:hypothetical protein